MDLTLVDSGVVIGFLDSDDVHHAAALRAIDEARAAGDRIAIAASSYAEILVGPARRGAGPIAVVQRFVAKLPVEVIDLDRDIALDAARLRAEHGARLRLPDALVVATARVRKARVLVTTDHRWPSARAMGLVGSLLQL